MRRDDTEGRRGDVPKRVVEKSRTRSIVFVNGAMTSNQRSPVVFVAVGVARVALYRVSGGSKLTPATRGGYIGFTEPCTERKGELQ